MDRPRKDSRIPVAGIPISHPERVVFPPDGPTKLDLARYHEAMAARMLKVMADRPLTLLRLPEGLGGPSFVQRHLPAGWPAAIMTVPITMGPGTEDHMAVRSAAGLVGAVQMGAVEFHVWGSRRDRLDSPDRMVFDLDPDEGLDWQDVRRAAFDLRDLLQDLGLPSWPMVTGGKGVHVIVQIRRTVEWEDVAQFSRAVAAHLAESEPQRFIATMSKEKRSGRIFVDYLRNERGATAIAPFSVRARPGAPVAFPLSWDRLVEVPAANAFTMQDALAEGDWQAVGLPGPVSLEAAMRRMKAG